MNYYTFQQELLKGKISTQKLQQVFAFLETNPLTKQEFLDIYKASKQTQMQIQTDFDTVDFVGTGGTSFDTFNISTISGLMFADFSTDFVVAKHGNKAVSSSVGSSNLLENLGVKFGQNEFEINQELQSNKFAFLFAPIFNPSFIFAKEARALHKKKTYFNLLGPLLNPTNPKFMLIGIFDIALADYYLEVLKATNVQKAWIVMGNGGINEIDPSGITQVVEYSKTSTKKFELNPQDFGIEPVKIENLATGDLEYNTKLAREIMSYKCQNIDKVNAVLVNIASMLVITNQVTNLKQAIQLCQTIYKQNQKLKSVE